MSKEIERASSKRRPIIALRIDDTPLTPALEYFLSESQWVDARSGLDAALAKLGQGVRRLAAPAGAFQAEAVAPLVRAAAPERRAPVAILAAAVLPFEDLSEKRDQGYFADGLSTELIELLGKVPGLRVPARTSSFYFKGKQATLADIGKALNVSHVLEGRVQKSDRQVRITTELVNVADDSRVWSESYDRRLDDIFKVQDNIATSDDHVVHGAAYQIALIYAGRHDLDRCFTWLDRAFEQRDAGMLWLKFDPRLKSLRADPRFTALTAKMGVFD